MSALTCTICGCVGRVGNALLGHPPEPLVCLRCEKARQDGSQRPAGASAMMEGHDRLN